MRTVTYGAACSLDGYIAGPAGEMDWLLWSDEVAAVMSAYWATVDTVLMGRRTWEAAAQKGMNPYPGVRNVVFSRTLDPGVGRGVEVVSSDPAEFVRALREAEGRGICLMGGGELAACLLDAGVVDEVGLNVHPLLLGGGIPLFRGTRRLDLEPAETRTFSTGCVYSRYRIRRGAHEAMGGESR